MPPMIGQRQGQIGGPGIRNGEVIPHPVTVARDLPMRIAKPVPPAMPDWGLEPAASSWIRLRLPSHPSEKPHLPPPRPREEPPLHLRLPPSGEEPEPKKPRNSADREFHKMATLMIWDLPHYVNCVALREVFEEVDGIVGVFYNSVRHLMLVDFASPRDASRARRDHLSSTCLTNLPLNVAFFRNNKYVLNNDLAVALIKFLRDTSSPWARPGSSVCIQGFNSSLHVEQNHAYGKSIGKAYIKCESWSCFSEALNLNGSFLGKTRVRVTECHGGSRFWDGHIMANGPVTGKRTVFNYDSDDG
ncbi:hypothetical protein ACP70R_006790 [Stipagrostis hirtigluma subsp. patula]